MERGLRPNETLNRDGGIAEFIISRGWETLTVVPMTAVVPVVREFYADAFFEQDNNLVIVRGTMVSFSANTINEYYETKWTSRANVAQSFQKNALNRYAKAWNKFICANLMQHQINMKCQRIEQHYCTACAMK
ncbi:hypothetical protein TIFTF001_016398 [Ficus carica]|uniref:Putative plant transposon protein domain-containing protein n=1 Tax=Ficus carica TaxID=3494 RepID=A0AA88DIU3_FICCA|nr:hypothetical protein TIFTF001_016398 [Ficus carica]